MDDLDQMGGPRTFGYGLWNSLPIYGALLCAACILFSFGAGAIWKHEIDASYVYFGLFLISLGVGSIYSLIRYHAHHLPIVVSEQGIAKISLGGQMAFINWLDLKKIERRRGFDHIWIKNRFVYYAFGQEQYIEFDEGINCLPDLLNLINLAAQKYKIEIVLVDLGTDTRRKIGLNEMDERERRKLMREGVRIRAERL